MAGDVSAAPPKVAELSALLSAVLDELVCVVRDGSITDINPAGCDLLGCGGSTGPVGRPLGDFLKIKNGIDLPELAQRQDALTAKMITDGGAELSVDVKAAALETTGDFLVVARDVTDRKAFAKLSRKTELVLNTATNGIIAVDLDGRITSFNPAAEKMLGVTANEVMGKPAGAFMKYADSALFEQAIVTRSGLEEISDFHDEDVEILRTDGGVFSAEMTCAPISDGGPTEGYAIILRDVSASKASEAQMRLSATVFEHSAEGLVVADAHGFITMVNPAFSEITGYAARDVRGKPIFTVLCEEDATRRAAMDTLAKEGKAEWEDWYHTKSGADYAARVVLSGVSDDAGKISQHVSILSDITERKKEEERILYQANYDALTGLPNRTLFMDRLDRVVKEARRAKTNVGLMFIDLDGFKAVNDTLGHEAGDLLLKGASERMLQSVRESDTVARLGGDEFTVIMPLLDGRDGAAFVADRILEQLVQPFDLDGSVGNISGSIGISLFPDQADDAQALLQNADAAMYRAKKEGKANYQFYTPDMAMTAH